VAIADTLLVLKPLQPYFSHKKCSPGQVAALTALQCKVIKGQDDFLGYAADGDIEKQKQKAPVL